MLIERPSVNLKKNPADLKGDCQPKIKYNTIAEGGMGGIEFVVTIWHLKMIKEIWEWQKQMKKLWQKEMVIYLF